MMKIITLLAGLSWLCCSLAYGQVSHVSINEKYFTLGQYPKLRVNVVTDRRDTDRLEFVVRQSDSEERLMVDGLNAFLLLLTGVDDVTDPNAQLVVKEYQVNRWKEIKVIPLFKEGEFSEQQIAQAQASIFAVKATTEQQELPQKRAQPTAEPTSAPINTPLASVDGVRADCQLEYKQGETLWRIGHRYASTWNTEEYATMLAIYEANLRAFDKKKITGLKKNAVLVCPSDALLQRQGDRRQALQKYQSLQ